MTIKELREKLKDFPDDAVLVVNVELIFRPFYHIYELTETRKDEVIRDLNYLLGKKLSFDTKIVLMK